MGLRCSKIGNVPGTCILNDPLLPTLHTPWFARTIYCFGVVQNSIVRVKGSISGILPVPAPALPNAGLILGFVGIFGALSHSYTELLRV